MNMPKPRFTGQPKRVIRTIVFENDRGALLASRLVLPADCAPVNGHRIRGWLHQEQAHGREFTGLGPCFFLMIQAKYRGFTGTAPHFRFASRPHGEERASRTPHGEERAKRASRTIGSSHHSRPWPVLRDGATRLLRTRMSSHANARRCGHRAQFQLWIFSYTNLARPSKKRLSRIMMGRCQRRNPHGAQRNAGTPTPDFAAPHPGYGSLTSCRASRWRDRRICWCRSSTDRYSLSQPPATTG